MNIGIGGMGHLVNIFLIIKILSKYKLTNKREIAVF